ncbi:MAG: histidine kinase, partial [Rubrivivax sp.]|nr:histidine kinase [Rubrivivax sp.]
ELVQAIEHESVIDVREKAERLLLAPAEVNRALLTALATAAQLE